MVPALPKTMSFSSRRFPMSGRRPLSAVPPALSAGAAASAPDAPTNPRLVSRAMVVLSRLCDGEQESRNVSQLRALFDIRRLTAMTCHTSRRPGPGLRV